MKATLAALAATFGFAVPAQAGTSNETVIRAVFGQYGSQAVAVARCESGLSVYAHNPNGHDGLFQFGSYAKARYGFAWDAWTQSRAAYRYFRDSGYRWGPWTCRPY